MVTFNEADVCDAMVRVAFALRKSSDELTRLDQVVGDGDLGITAAKIADALDTAGSKGAENENLGRFLIDTGLAINRAAASTMGTLSATALMNAGKAISEKSRLSLSDLSQMLTASEAAVRSRGKASLGDKTIVDVLNPASKVFSDTVDSGNETADILRIATNEMLDAALEGLERVTPLANRVGRAGWVGVRTKGEIDPGCALVLLVLKAIARQKDANLDQSE